MDRVLSGKHVFTIKVFHIINGKTNDFSADLQCEVRTVKTQPNPSLRVKKEWQTMKCC